MTNQKKTGGKKALAFILAAVILSGAFAGIGWSAPAGVCSKAFDKCMVGVVAGLSGGLLGIVVAVSSCLAGYDFCRKYVI